MGSVLVLLSVLSLFGVALLAPLVVRGAGRWSGWLLALAPAGWAGWYASHFAAITSGQPLSPEPISWAPQLGFDVAVRVDGLSLLFSLLILGIGALVAIYAGGYLRGHAQLGRFFGFLFAFMASMLGLVVSDNLILIFAFWELTSITSYLLIGFGHEREAARKAAMQALLITGIGGLALLAGLVMLGLEAGTFSVSGIVASGVDVTSSGLYVPIIVLVLLGCFTKSAQVPFHFWLPGAMEAPAPVSAYLHSSTMVKAGVFLLARLDPVLGASDPWDWTLKLVGGATMVYAAYLASRETYFKRVLAFTTVSALGAMVMLIGLIDNQSPSLGNTAAMAFLLAHALYKGALFMVAGAVEHSTHTKDVEKLSGLMRRMPVTFIAAALAAVSMLGVPPLFGYAGKHLLKESFDQSWVWSEAMLLGTMAVTAFTAVAGLLVAWKPFTGATNEAAAGSHGAGVALVFGPLVLAALGVVAGFAPGVFAEPLVASSTRAITGGGEVAKLDLAEIVKFSWWTAIGLTIGVLLYMLRAKWRRWTAPFHREAVYGPRLFNAAYDGTLAVAGANTRLLQNGSLNTYIRTVIAALIGLGVLFTWRRVDVESLTPEPLALTVFDVVLIALAAGGALSVTLFRKRLAAVAGLGVVGLAVALTFVVFGAPDVAMTQFAIETLTVLIFVLVFYHLPQFKTYTTRLRRAADWTLSVGFGAFMALLVLIAATTEFAAPISEYFSEQAVPEAKGRNIVNVIIVDFRATDTFGELVVLALAAIGVATLLHRRRGRGPEQIAESPLDDASDAAGRGEGAS